MEGFWTEHCWWASQCLHRRRSHLTSCVLRQLYGPVLLFVIKSCVQKTELGGLKIHNVNKFWMLSSKYNCISETGDPRAILVKKTSPVSMGKNLTNTDCRSTSGVYTACTCFYCCRYISCVFCYEVSFFLSVLTDGISKCYIIKFYLKMSSIDSTFISCYNSSLYQSTESWENPS